MYQYKAKIINVVDGDTVDAEVDLGFTVWVKVRFRLYGIDTPEVNSKNPLERQKAQEAKQFVEERLLNQTRIIQTYKTDKYGRWLAEIFIDGDLSINEALLNEGLASDYK